MAVRNPVSTKFGPGPTLRCSDLLSLDITHGGNPVTDLLIRDVPEEVVAAIDGKARRLGLSRSEYLRRALVREQATTGERVTVDDLAWFAAQFVDLTDEGVMRSAWD